MGNMGVPQLQAASPAAPVMAPASSVPVPTATFQSPMNPQMYQGPNPRRPSNFLPQTPSGGYQPSPAAHPYPSAQASPYGAYPSNRGPSGVPVYNPNAPRPIEVYHLGEAANAAIPADIRNQFHCDDRGNVLFFSAPPLDIIPPMQPKLGHSLKYLVSKEARQKKIAEHKRKRAAEQEERDEEAKRQRADEETALAARIEALAPRAISMMVSEVVGGTDQLYKVFYEDQADRVRAADNETRDSRIDVDRVTHQHTADIQAHSSNQGFVNLKGDSMYLGESRGEAR